LFAHPDVDFAGLQTRQVLPDSVAPLPTKFPLIQHPAWQLPPLQIWPLPQPVPLPSCDHDVADEEGWQVWQGLVELTAPLG